MKLKLIYWMLLLSNDRTRIFAWVIYFMMLSGILGIGAKALMLNGLDDLLSIPPFILLMAALSVHFYFYKSILKGISALIGEYNT